MKIHHVLIFFTGSFSVPIMVEGSASLLTHTWLWESEVLPHPHLLVMVERVGERWSLPLPILLIAIFHWFLLATIVGHRLPSPTTQQMYQGVLFPSHIIYIKIPLSVHFFANAFNSVVTINHKSNQILDPNFSYIFKLNFLPILLHCYGCMHCQIFIHASYIYI